MPQTEEQRILPQRVTDALRTLSVLARQTSTLRFASPETRKDVATAFLAQLLAQCDASQGALFFRRPGAFPETEAPLEGELNSATVSFVACVQMNEDEAFPALATARLSPVDPTRAEKLPAALVWRRVLTPAFSFPVSGPTPLLPCQAFLLFVWPSPEPTRGQQQTQALHLLSALADLIETILLHLWMAQPEGYQEQASPAELVSTELLATVGHELRGPLTTIQGYTETLLRHEPRLSPEERQAFLRVISQTSLHLGALVERFLEVAQFEMGAHPFTPVPIHLLALAQEAVTALRTTRPHPLLLTPGPGMQRGPEASVDDKHLPERWVLTGDRQALRTLLDILLENAAAYSATESLIEVSLASPETAPVLVADAHRAPILPATFQEGEPLLELRVRDHGIGIDPAHLPQLFRRFSRIDQRLIREVNGLGLGLALAKAIVAQHRGMLWVESTPGEGSTFAVILPRGNALESE